jgi:hypothetical protein
MKGNDTNMNTPKDVVFIQYHQTGVTSTAYNIDQTELTSGKRSRLVIGLGNDAHIGTGTNGEELWLQNAGANDLKHSVVNIGYTILDTGKVSSSIGFSGNTIKIIVGD